MTMLLITLSAKRDELRWASAGHGPPIVYDPVSDAFPPLEGGGLPLGIEAAADYSEYGQPGIGSGTIILASTDGLTETMNQKGELFGEDRLLDLLRVNANKRASEISEAIRESLAEYRGPVAQDDDLTFVVAKVL
jgi:sigma-B regulation protein RsbU (phosphoserine phosphatase)